MPVVTPVVAVPVVDDVTAVDPVVPLVETDVPAEVTGRPPSSATPPISALHPAADAPASQMATCEYRRSRPP
jgi:hypothetical protein